MNISTNIRKAYRDMYVVDLSQDMVDLVSTGRKSLLLTEASLSILISRSRQIETIDPKKRSYTERSRNLDLRHDLSPSN